MLPPPTASRLVSFGRYEVDLKTGELRKNGLKIRLQAQPFQLLAMLLERPGEVVTREDLQHRLWPGNTFVDFEVGLNKAIKKLRGALCDSAAGPRYIETLPRRGYRFIAKVEEGTADKPAQRHPERALLPKRWRIMLVAGASAGLVGVVLAINLAGLRSRVLAVVSELHAGAPTKVESLAVLPFENLSSDPEQESFADAMTEALTTELGKVDALKVTSRTSVLRYKQTKKPLPEIARELNVGAILEGTVQRSGSRVRITANLLEGRTDKHLWAEAYERETRDMLVLESEVARDIAGKIPTKLNPQKPRR
ncbi:MAG: winged helix-turn-helix domain-containing protein [Acidobacteriia bacterium]|nr:winged helix-turn-helix domain-containing protein [Terriglobia bacterium]